MEYDEYYLTENLFGDPYPELLEFYTNLNRIGKLLDLGCGQGRDAIALAKLGFEVIGIDTSKVGIEQLNKIAQHHNLSLVGEVKDIYQYSDFDQFDFILLDSMFHFGKKEKQQESDLLNRIFNESKASAVITICIQKMKAKIKVLESLISSRSDIKVFDKKFLEYLYEDKSSGHKSSTEYMMISIEKI